MGNSVRYNLCYYKCKKKMIIYLHSSGISFITLQRESNYMIGVCHVIQPEKRVHEKLYICQSFEQG